MWQVWVVVLAGCAWLTEVPEDQVPTRTAEPAVRTRANDVDVPEQLSIDPAGHNAAGAARVATEAEYVDLRPVAVPIEVESPAPFKFKAENGTIIYNGSVESTGEARLRGLTNAEWEETKRHGL
jgi:hypothetical protein